MEMKNMPLRTGLFGAAVILVCCFLMLISGCSGEPDIAIQKKLTAVIESDFKEMLHELPATSISDSVYYRTAKYKTYTKGLYRAMAVVDYYYLKSVKVKRTVKYRYVKKAAQWERYGNEYQFYGDSTGH